MSAAPTQWVVGSTTYTKVAQDNVEYAVPAGKSVDDRNFIFIIRKDPKTEHIFFVQATTRSKVWELPDQFAAGAQPVVPQVSIRDRVLAMYQKYNPEKVGNVDMVIEKYGGEANGEKLLEDLKTKYGPEPKQTAAAAGAKSKLTPRERVVLMYEKYNPSGVGKVDMVMEKYAGQEDKLIEDLVTKYGPEPTPPSSGASDSSSAPPSSKPPAVPAKERTYRERVYAIYAKNKPAKAQQLTDKGLETYKGQEQALIDTLVAKYGPEPEPEAAPGTPPTEKSNTPEKEDSMNGIRRESANTAGGGESTSPAAATSSPGSSFANPSSPKEGKKVKIPVERTYRERVFAIYSKHKPGKAAQLTDKGLETYKGQEQALLDTLIAKYGAEPEPEQEEAPAAASTTQQEAAPVTTAEPQATAPPAEVGQGTPEAKSEPAPQQAESATPQQQAEQAQPEEKKQPEPMQQTQQPKVKPQTPPPQEEPKMSSTFDFGDKNKNAANLARAQAEVAANGGNQEQLLVTFIQDRDERLLQAHTRTERVTQSLDDLRSQTAALQKQLHEARAQSDMELQGMKSHSAKIQEETDFAKQSWELERQKLSAQADVAALVAEKTVQEEKVQFEKDRADFQRLQAQLEESLAKLEAEIAQREKQSSRMLQLLDTKDKDVRGLNEELAILKAENRHVPTAACGCQTDKENEEEKELTPEKHHQSLQEVEQQVSNIMDREVKGSPSPGATRASPPRLNLAGAQQQQQVAQQEDEDAALFAEYEQLMQGQRNRRDELEEWKRKARMLEREVTKLKNQSLLQQSERNCAECAKKIKVVLSLRNNTKALEKKVADLEMNLLALPTEAPTSGTAGGQTAAELLSEKHSLESQCNLLQKELSETKSVARSQKKEIADLRGLLSIHRSSPAGGLRAVLGAKSSAIDSNSNKKKNSGTMGSAGRGL